ncbi:MAG TPA: hypothetical protein VMV93_07300 [Chloroflexota bacterium]|nr:hypothetical protein [Chloroflexota bacterium]
MSRNIGSTLPEPICQLLSGRDLAARWGQTIQLATIDAEGFPHFGILTYGEIVCTAPAQVRLGLYPNSSTSRNLRERGRAGLLLVAGPALYYLKGQAAEAASHAPETARFDVTLHTVLVDDEPGSTMTSGLTFELASGKEAWLATAAKTLAALV